MNKKKLAAALCTVVIMTGCTAQTTEESVNISQQEKEIGVITEWFAESMTDAEEFPDMKEYQYYARAVGLDKDAFLSADMWEVFYSESVNINRDVDEKAIYLIRLDPNKLLKIYAANNNSTVEGICERLSLTPEQLYYNWGFTSTAVNYTKNHKDNKSSYSAEEAGIFGIDNGEDRETVMSTHFLTVDISGGNRVKYSNSIPELEIKQRDILRSTSKMTYNYSDYTEDEKNPAFHINGIGIRCVLPLSVPNGWRAAEDKDITVMFNSSPFSYGCTDRDKIILPEKESEVSE